MELKFLGRGSSFNPIEGSTSAYFIENDELFLIDCGESVYASLAKLGILNEVKRINILITHTHSDHVGSLGSLVLHSYYIMNKKTNILVEDNVECRVLDTLLKVFDCDEQMFRFVQTKDLDYKYSSFDKVRILSTKHGNRIPCYSLLFDTKDGCVYYSGDTSEVETLSKLIESGTKIDKIYIDTNTNKLASIVHVPLEEVDKVVPDYLKSRVYCMHVSNDEAIKKAREFGFNVVDVEEGLKLTLK